jgi:cyclohexadienyl dehydratase
MQQYVRLLAVMISLAYSVSVQAGQVLDHVRATGELRVGTTGDYTPYSFRNTDDTYVGADIEMAQRLAARLGARVVFVPTIWSQLEADYAAGKFDIAMGGISILPKRSAIGPFAQAMDVDGKRPITRCVDQDRFTSIAAIDRPDVRVVVNPGASNEAFARANFAHANLSIHPDNATVFNEILAGRADVMVTDGVEVDHQSMIHHELCPAHVAAPFTEVRKSYWVEPDDDLLREVNAFVADELNSGRWRATMDKALAAP